MSNCPIKRKGQADAKNFKAILREYIGYFYFACYTDKGITGGKLQTSDSIDVFKLLEIRVYNDATELHAVRYALDEDFGYRVVCDEELDAEFCSDETQLLDVSNVDSVDAENHSVTFTAIGGGSYTVAAEQGDGNYIKIRNYISYDEETGRARVYDFRIVKILYKLKGV